MTCELSYPDTGLLPVIRSEMHPFQQVIWKTRNIHAILRRICDTIKSKHTDINKMIKILYICSEATAGLTPYAVNIIRCASKSPLLDVYAITVDGNGPPYRPHFDGKQAEKISFLKISPGGWRKKADKIYPLKILQEAKRMCKAHRVDVIHLLTVDYTCALIVPQLKKIAEVYYTVHDFMPHESAFKTIRERVMSAYIRLGVESNMKRIDNLATNSNDQYDMIKKAYPGKKVYCHVFPSLITGSIIDGNEVCPELRDAGKYILFFGNIDKYKGVKYLYDAFVNNDRLSGYKLVIAGRGAIYFPHSCSEPRVVFLNRYIKDEEVKALFRQAACVVYPYLSATQSGALTLAYCFRTPVIASDIPFFRKSAAGDSCLFFKSADAADLSRKLETLLFETDLSRMKAAQKEYYDKYYSEDAAVSSLKTIYKY
jgi:glycosyltransferase involved in cell wall biosynthesis